MACAAALLAGCGSSSHSANPAASNGVPGVARSISSASCADWKHGSVAQRRRTVADLRAFAGGPIGSSQALQHGRVLTDAQALKLFDSYCANYFARGFKLYKLYERAAAFVGR